MRFWSKKENAEHQQGTVEGKSLWDNCNEHWQRTGEQASQKEEPLPPSPTEKEEVSVDQTDLPVIPHLATTEELLANTTDLSEPPLVVTTTEEKAASPAPVSASDKPFLDYDVKRLEIAHIELDADYLERISAGDDSKLLESIQDVGVINPVSVYESEGCYKLIEGKRRVLAAKKAGHTNIWAKVFEGDFVTLKRINRLGNDTSLMEKISKLDHIRYQKYLLDKGIVADTKALAAFYTCSERHIQQGLKTLAMLDSSEELWTFAKNSSYSQIKIIANAEVIPEHRRELLERCANDKTYSVRRLKDDIRTLQNKKPHISEKHILAWVEKVIEKLELLDTEERAHYVQKPAFQKLLSMIN